MLYFLFQGNGKKMTKHFKKIISYRLKNRFKGLKSYTIISNFIHELKLN